MEFFRDTGTLIWNLLFPIFLIFGFAFAFSGDNATYKIGTLGNNAPKIEFMNYRYLKFIPYDSMDLALKKLTHHGIDLVMDFRSNTYYVNSESPNSYLVEKILLSDREQKFEQQIIRGDKIRYIDWFIPGVIAMNIMFGCIFGVGYVIVRYRQNGVLKRFKATPMHAIEFVSAQVFSRFFIVAFMTVLIYTGTNFFLHFRMSGSYLDLILLTTLAILCMISLGLLFATRFKSEEVASGLMNLVTWPMMMLSGLWFSLEGTPQALQTAAKIFPTTHFVDAARQIMLDGTPLMAVMDHVIVLAAMTVVFLILSALLFKWE